ncbi:Aste57867_18481 [Aphanomyces stellatus]|uniref:Aste57867_18481 protein n=1 Tax=Aphanomyces stellatus TaxID=120398 RepID=A0A485LDZ6_9STRA|nr:hypothetical protein As57867_018419 [Aphanomyces stellatus]VFT95217.1 Aste57867_18481 [Aphanomyces stellatus]
MAMRLIEKKQSLQDLLSEDSDGDDGPPVETKVTKPQKPPRPGGDVSKPPVPEKPIVFFADVKPFEMDGDGFVSTILRYDDGVSRDLPQMPLDQAPFKHVHDEIFFGKGNNPKPPMVAVVMPPPVSAPLLVPPPTNNQRPPASARRKPPQMSWEVLPLTDTADEVTSIEAFN